METSGIYFWTASFSYLPIQIFTSSILSKDREMVVRTVNQFHKELMAVFTAVFNTRNTMPTELTERFDIMILSITFFMMILWYGGTTAPSADISKLLLTIYELVSLHPCNFKSYSLGRTSWQESCCYAYIPTRQ